MLGARRQSLPYGREQGMDLGNFSISLAVKDVAASRAFYEKLGFKAFAGEASQGTAIRSWSISTCDREPRVGA